MEADWEYHDCVCVRVGVVMEIRLSKNLAHQMDKHWIGFIIFFSSFFIAIRQLLNPTNDLQLRVFF